MKYISHLFCKNTIHLRWIDNFFLQLYTVLARNSVLQSTNGRIGEGGWGGGREWRDRGRWGVRMQRGFFYSSQYNPNYDCCSVAHSINHILEASCHNWEQFLSENKWAHVGEGGRRKVGKERSCNEPTSQRNWREIFRNHFRTLRVY